MYVCSRENKEGLFSFMVHLKSINKSKVILHPAPSLYYCHFIPSTNQCYHSTRTLYSLPNRPFSSTPGPYPIPHILSFLGIRMKFRPIAIDYATPAESPSRLPLCF